jgi:hypothetical protein
MSQYGDYPLPETGSSSRAGTVGERDGSADTTGSPDPPGRVRAPGTDVPLLRPPVDEDGFRAPPPEPTTLEHMPCYLSDNIVHSKRKRNNEFRINSPFR